MLLHAVPSKHRPNVLKQASQIRQCLIQAREYKEAAAATSLATKPLLLYYSLMSLALAQILFKGGGNDSLDAARGEHSHHGLVFRTPQVPKDAYQLATTASRLIAEPMTTGGKRRGTFELWHRTAREDPVVGLLTRPSGDGTTTAPAHVFFVGRDERMGEIPEQGISLLDCFAGTPGMLEWLAGQDVNSDVVRAMFNGRVLQDGGLEQQLVVHPHRADRIQQFSDDIKIRASDVDRVNITELASAFVLRVQDKSDDRVHMSLPPCAMWTTDEIRFLPSKTSINEFGYIYIGLYILGNYARYFPDRWMVDVESGSPLAMAAEEFVAMAEWRMALLTLSDLSQNYLVRQI
ncbi:YaaC family protein [Microvirga solisilvae]|uniref:YaaC family protein n=1 Tax=Microvirga solisilvae TaxID=2919498 RepID=UPI003C6CD2C1